MSIGRRTLPAILLAAFLALALLVGVGCDGDPYSGTWRSTTAGRYQDDDGTWKTHRATMVIAKADNAWSVTDVLGNIYIYREDDGELVMVRNPSGPVSGGSRLKLVDGRLIVVESDGTEIMRFAKD